MSSPPHLDPHIHGLVHNHEFDSFCFDPNSTLIMHHIKGRNAKGLRKKFEAVAPLTFWHPLVHDDIIIVAYNTEEEAIKAKESIKEEKIVFCYEDTTVHSNSLLLPPQMRAFLTSPPPSPPEDWAPHNEDINKKAYIDLEAAQLADGNVELLPKSATMPSIVIVPEKK